MFLLNILWYLWSLGKCFTISFIKIFPTLILTWLPYRELSHITLLISTRLTEPCLWDLFFLLKHHSFLKLCHNPFRFLKFMFVARYFWHTSGNIRPDEDVSKASFVFVFRRHPQGVFKASWSRRIYSPYSYVFRRRLQDVFKCLDQDQYIRLGHTSSRRLQVVFKTSSRHLQDVLQRCLQDVFKTYHQVKLFA